MYHWNYFISQFCVQVLYEAEEIISLKVAFTRIVNNSLT